MPRHAKPTRSLLLFVLGLVVASTGCNRTEAYCRRAAEERNRNEPSHAFPVDAFMRACRRLPADHAQCTVPTFAGSYAVMSEHACTAAYNNPDFPRDILLGVARGNGATAPH